MEKYKIPVGRIKKAQIRYNDLNENGIEIPEIKGYTLFYKKGDTYINIFNFIEDCNIWDRTPYTSSTQSGEDHGNKLILACGEDEAGICYVLEPGVMKEFKGRADTCLREIYEIVANSDDYYIDRAELLIERPFLLRSRDRKNVMKKDEQMRLELMDYIAEKTLEYGRKKIKEK